MISCETIDMTEMIEEDTFHGEDTLNITECVREGMPCEDLCLQECVSYNRRVFNGWMKQPSACCAAASVAGAFNSLSCRRRGDEGALNHSSVLQIYEVIFSELVSKQKLDLERRLGSTIDALLALLEVELLKLGRIIGGVKVATATKASVINCIKRICRNRLISQPNLNLRAIMKEGELAIFQLRLWMRTIGSLITTLELKMSLHTLKSFFLDAPIYYSYINFTFW